MIKQLKDLTRKQRHEYRISHPVRATFGRDEDVSVRYIIENNSREDIKSFIDYGHTHDFADEHFMRTYIWNRLWEYLNDADKLRKRMVKAFGEDWTEKWIGYE